MDANQKTDGAKESTGPVPAAAPQSTISPAPAGSSAARRPAGGPWVKRVVLGLLGLAVVAAAAYFGVPMVWLALNTVSTDDAYVNGHVTFVAARVAGQVKEVKVDDNKYVPKGTLLVVLDKEPFQKEVDRKQADLVKAKADREDAAVKVVAMVDKARSSRFNMDNAINLLNAQVNQLLGAVEVLNGDLAVRFQAKKEYDSYSGLIKNNPGATTELIVEQKNRDYLVAKANVIKSLEAIYQIRTSFGLTTKRVNAEEITKAPQFLGETPPDLDQTAPVVRQATSDLRQAASQLGITASSFDLTPRKLLEEFYKRDPDPMGDPEQKLDRILQVVIKKAPTIVQADAQVAQAESNLAVALLNRSYCDVYAEIDGVVTRRSVNPGNNVQAGQALMAIRSLTEIWIDANFKETQLRYLKIGQRVKIETDMYGSHKEFEGRITGFTMGTGQTLSLLPPQNATGNFVKIVQRLPVKVELIGYNAYSQDDKPLFYGLSVTPYVYYKEPLIENDPGKGNFLQPFDLKGASK